MNNNYNYNQQPNYSQPMNNMNQPMNYSQQPMNNANTGYNANYGFIQQKPPFKFPGIAKDLPSILGYIGALIMLIGSFMNFATIKVVLEGKVISENTINYFITNGSIKDGFLILLLAIAALALVHFRKNLFALIPTGISGIILIADIVDTNSIIQDAKASYESYSWLKYEVNANFGPAPFIVGIGIILIIVHAVLYFVNKNKSKQVQMNNMYPNNGMNYNNQPVNNMNQPMNQNMNYNQPINQPMNQNMNYNQQPMNNMNQYPNNNNMY